jgi:transposase
VKVIIGVDPHKSVNAVAAIDGDGELLGHEVFPANRAGLRKLERWAKRFFERRWAVEGAAGIGRPAAQKLVGSGEEVVEVPPKLSLSVKVRVLSSFAGNCRLNKVVHMVAVCQARSDPRGRTYYLKKLEEGKSHREAMRCLKRRISDAVFRALVADLELASRATA